MKYQKPQIVVYGERDVAEWAVPQVSLPKSYLFQDFSPKACTGGKCCNGGSKAKAPELSTLVVSVAEAA
jgi:hypothetical protein